MSCERKWENGAKKESALTWNITLHDDEEKSIHKMLSFAYRHFLKSVK